MVEDQPVLSEEDYTLDKMRRKMESIKPVEETEAETLRNQEEDDVDESERTEG